MQPKSWTKLLEAHINADHSQEALIENKRSDALNNVGSELEKFSVLQKRQNGGIIKAQNETLQTAF